MLRKLLLTSIVCLLGFATAFAQSGTLTGTITDSKSGETLPGANVFIPSIQKGDNTDATGEYTISNIPPGTYTVRVSYVGYETINQQTNISAESQTLNFSLNAGINLSEVVVTGYSSTSKVKSNISTSSVSEKDIVNRPNVSVTQRLQGQVPGLNITSSNGQPGANTTINLRGVSSLNGNTEPLFIIDGTPVDEDNFRSLNPDEISNVTILKDAGATAIYGNRGANGVVVIETKKGSYDSGFQVSYSGQVKTTSLAKRNYTFLSGPEQLRLERSLGVGDGAGALNGGEPLTDQEIAAAPTTDWVDYFFDPSLSQSHTLSLTNGRENIKTLTSLGFTNQDGALQDSRLQRFNLRNNITGRSENRKFDYNVNSSINFSKNNTLTSLGTSGVNQNPILAAYQGVPYLAPSDYESGAQLLSRFRGFADTPLFLIDKLTNNTNDEDETKLVGSANASYEFIDGLSLNGSVGADYEKEVLTSTQGPTSFNSILFAQSGNDTPGSSTYFNTETLSYNLNTNLKYETQFSELHSINAGAYFEIFQAFYDRNGYTNNGLDSRTFSPGDGSGFISDNAQNDFFSNTVSANKLQAGLVSYFGTLDYDYDTRYGIGLSLRRDASYRFSDTNRWGTFYSISARWNISNEEFMQNSVFDVLKLRGSYGKTGNQRIVDNDGQFAYFGGATLTQSLFATGTGYLGQNASFLDQIGNPNLKWETVYQKNLGIDFEVFDSRLRGSFDGYIKTTEDLFQDRPVSAINSVTNQRANIGSLENRGVDVELNYDILQSRSGLNMTIGLVGNYNKQELLEIPTPTNQVILNGVQVNHEGGPIGEYYVYHYEGVNPENGNLLFRDKDGNITEDVGQADRQYTGKNIYPDFSGSLNFNIGYKGLSLTTQWQYAVGVDRFDFNYEGYVDPDNIGSFVTSKDILDSWTPDNTDAPLPSYSAANRGLDDSSDRFLQESDYIRLRYVSLGYNIPPQFLESLKLRGANVFISGENLLTFTKWDGASPETLNGVNSRLYPNARIFTAGLEIQL